MRAHSRPALALLAAVACMSCTSTPPEPAPAAPAAAPQGVLDLAHFLRDMTDLDRLPLLEDGVACRQFSSYDRKSRLDAAGGRILDNDANGDSGQYVRIEPTGEAVMAEMEGPGCIRRIWSANPTGKIRFYFDGAAAPSLEYDFNALFSGDVRPFVKPLVWQRRLDTHVDLPSSDCYLPIPYAKRCKVTADKAHHQYYHIGYQSFPASQAVRTFDPGLAADEAAALDAACRTLRAKGEDPQGASDRDAEVEVDAPLPPGAARTIAALDGPGTIRRVFARLASDERWASRKVLLQMYWDGEEKPSVEAPIGDFFGDAWEGAEYRSLPLGITKAWSYCYWRMPFARAARIVVTNQGSKPASLQARVAWRPGPVPPGAGRFHARWRRERNSEHFDYPILVCVGRGRFVGAALYPHNIVGGWWGEGDEKIRVDGEKFPSTFGTGSEDYFGDAWGIRRFDNAFHGCPTRLEHPRQSCYRWHIPDSIPFATSFALTIENYAAIHGGAVRNDYSSVAYWYQAPGGKDFFASAPVSERIPQGPVASDGQEAEVAVGDPPPAGATVVTDDDLPVDLSRNRGLKVSGPAGTTVALHLQSPEDGRYTIEAVTAKGVKGSTFEILKDGRPVGDRERLAAGRNPVAIRLTGAPVEGDRCEVILDYFRLHPWRNFVQRWWLIGPFDNTDDKMFDEPYGPETEPFDAAKTYPGKGGAEAKWRTIEDLGGVLVAEHGRFFDDNDDIVVYLACTIVSPDDRKATAYAGSDDGIKVWVNGKLAHSNHAHRGTKPDDDRFEIELKKGANPVLVKIEQGKGPWGVCLRVNDPDEALRYERAE